MTIIIGHIGDSAKRNKIGVLY